MAKIPDIKAESGQSDHDLLIMALGELRELRNQFSNHLKHHWAVTIIALAAALTGLSSLLVGLILLLCQ